MTLRRRRFICLSAAAALCGPAATAATPAAFQTLRGRALGADISLTLHGVAQHRASLIWQRVLTLLDRIERQASLYRTSDLTRLNRTGILAHPGPVLRDLFTQSDTVHDATGGAFDPTVQVLWDAIARGDDPTNARTLCGWSRIRRDDGAIRLQPGMKLTFNGIAQGYAADRVAALIRHEGLTDVLIDMGEISALGRAGRHAGWPVDIASADGKTLRRIALADRAIATSSPAGTTLGPARKPHIFHPSGQPALWQTVSVSATSAALADAFSTAFCLMPRARIDDALARFPDARLEMLA